jgi:hypothetical protein
MAMRGRTAAVERGRDVDMAAIFAAETVRLTVLTPLGQDAHASGNRL